MKILSAVFSILMSTGSVFADPAVVSVEDQYVHVAVFNPGEKALLCPEHDIMLEARTGIFSGDFQAVSGATAGRGCLLAESGSWGFVKAVHISNYAQVKFRWLVATDLDAQSEVRLEDPEQRYWAYAFNLRDQSGKKIEPFLSETFR